MAEEELQKEHQLFSYGEIVHNEEETERLEKEGLKTIGQLEFSGLKDDRVLFRAHGEAPLSYQKASENNLNIVDATCPIVKKLQEKVADQYREMKLKDGKILIYGKAGHPEVIGLSGQAKNEALIVRSVDDLSGIDFKKPIRLFAQTTMDGEGFEIIKSGISERMNAMSDKPDFKAYKTICRQVSSREPHIRELAGQMDVMIFVSGKNSSNGKYLYEACHSVNPNTYHISAPEELEREWFNNASSVGISGATSTPGWLLTRVAEIIQKIQ